MDGVNDFLAFLQYSTSLQVLFMGWMEILKVRLETRGGPQQEMVCGCFRFRDQEFLKFLNFAKNETKIYKLAALRQCEFSFQRKTQEFKDF